MEFFTQTFSIFPVNPSNLSDALRPKRRQVKNACINCQKACKKCDEGRPCQRCIKYGLGDTCRDSTRKERRKGERRGPYLKKETKPRYTTPHNEPHFSVISPNTTVSKVQALPRNIEQQQLMQKNEASTRSASPASSADSQSDILKTPPPSPLFDGNTNTDVEDMSYDSYSSKIPLMFNDYIQSSKPSEIYTPVLPELPSLPSLHTQGINCSYNNSWMESNLQLPPLSNNTPLPSIREVLSSINC
ncbi:hypothetical protein K493DRAFT_69779 [Basidiobolus meristosporus CBS 931.73]|uniref:Zn(2)-C6 fungal-type domain-containing protein n=1 Tax=Basidiobolus meristosporus CBS 931.73 TaxID=1314790 RepID=A0A1Y1XU59_9FUNG|nr:hypothetical protein K493DRAFT_69779 [Basidiobolus meristosporus CBS 931.73]|eukprot:ORX89291.1 hypothetical protein K493DRAFT_69779 [Basidiobolus meristosporus CBS 931.73]